MMSLNVLGVRLQFSINFFLDFMARAKSIFKIFTSMNLGIGSFLKPFIELTVRVLCYSQTPKRTPLGPRLARCPLNRGARLIGVGTVGGAHGVTSFFIDLAWFYCKTIN